MNQLERILGESTGGDQSLVGVGKLNRLLQSGQLTEINLGTNRVASFGRYSDPKDVVSRVIQYLIVPGENSEVWKVDPTWTGQVSLKRVEDPEELGQIKDYMQRTKEITDGLQYSQ